MENMNVITLGHSVASTRLDDRQRGPRGIVAVTTCRAVTS